MAAAGVVSDGGGILLRLRRTILQAEPASQKDPRIPHAVNNNRRPQILGFCIHNSPGPSQNAERQKCEFLLVVYRKENSANKGRPGIGLLKQQKKSWQKKPSVQDFFPPGRCDARGNKSHQRGQQVLALRVDELGNNRGFLGLFEGR